MFMERLSTSSSCSDVFSLSFVLMNSRNFLVMNADEQVNRHMEFLHELFLIQNSGFDLVLLAKRLQSSHKDLILVLFQ